MTRVGAPRMKALFAAALRHRGDQARMAKDLCISVRLLRQRLSILRHEDVASLIDLVDPRKLGKPQEVVVFVSLVSVESEMVASIERRIATDENVAAAYRVTGKADYRLTAYHEDRFQAELWAKALRAWPEAGQVELVFTQTLFGDTLRGLRVD